MGKIIAISNQKGGVGKTTTAINLSASIAASEKKTLLIDLDPQGNATSGVGIKKGSFKRGMYHCLVMNEPLENITLGTELENLRVAPSDRNLAGAEVELVDFEQREFRLKKLLIADFVEATAGDSRAPVRAPELQLGAMRAILWTDIVDHTPMMHRHGDARGRELLREHERITREELVAHGGTEVKAMGDGFMTWFSSAQKALECAVAMQRAFAARNASGAEPLLIRAGVNAGEPIIEDDDLFGTSVIAASRICAQAGGGEIVVSDVVRQLVAGKNFQFADRGEVVLKGFEDPVRLWDVGWTE